MDDATVDATGTQPATHVGMATDPEPPVVADPEPTTDTVAMAPAGVGTGFLWAPRPGAYGSPLWHDAGLVVAAGALVVTVAFVILGLVSSHLWRPPPMPSVEADRGEISSPEVAKAHLGESTPGPSLTSTPPSEPGPTSLVGVQTFTVAGVEIIAGCQGDLAQVLASTSSQNFTIKKITPGPARVASVELKNRNARISMSVTCSGRQPVVQVRQRA
jgi:hypothetical protein